MAHFHYTIMGGLVFALMAGIYYWLPKMTGFKLNEKLGKVHFWTMFVFFNLTFFPLFAAGLLGMPRRVSSYNAEPAHAQRVRLDRGVLPRRLDAASSSANLVWSLVFKRERAGGQPVAVAGARVAAALAGPGPQLRADPEITGHPVRLRRPRRAARRRARAAACVAGEGGAA